MSILRTDTFSVNILGAEIYIAGMDDYIRFKPGTQENDGNIYVTVGIVRWNAHGKYLRLAGLTINSTPAASPPEDSNDFPTWNKIVWP